MSMNELLYVKNHATLTTQDVATLADWADKMKKGMGDRSRVRTYHEEYARAFALIREGADLLIRTRASLEGDGICPECNSASTCGRNMVPNSPEVKWSWKPWNFDENNSHQCTNSWHENGLSTYKSGLGYSDMTEALAHANDHGLVPRIHGSAPDVVYGDAPDN
jgi:hypothetical protein